MLRELSIVILLPKDLEINFTTRLPFFSTKNLREGVHRARPESRFARGRAHFNSPRNAHWCIPLSQIELKGDFGLFIFWGRVGLNHRPTGYESVYFPHKSSLTNCLHHYDTKTYAFKLNKEICCLLAKIGSYCVASVPWIFKGDDLKKPWSFSLFLKSLKY